MNTQRKTVLWLVSWYPNKWDAFEGDFIQRHARAASQYNDVHVLFIKQAIGQKGLERTRESLNGLTEEIIYIPKRKGSFQKLYNHQQWLKQYKAEVENILKQYRPGFIHVHVPWKAGLVALWAKQTHHVPYIVTEHWGIYNQLVEDNITTWPFWRRNLLRKIFKEAQTFLSVSNYLGKGVNELLLPKPFAVIPNAVDATLFQPQVEKAPIFTFLHVSNMVPLKNVEGLLRAFKRAKENGVDAQLLMVGNRDKKYVDLADDLRLGSSIQFFGEVGYAKVAEIMRLSHVLVLNSNIENSPCVIGEALCCGLPVIATSVGGIPELVNAQNGFLVPPFDEQRLSGCMEKMFKNYAYFTTDQIAVAACETFSIHSLAKQFKALYGAV